MSQFSARIRKSAADENDATMFEYGLISPWTGELPTVRSVSMCYHIRPSQGETWSIINERDKCIFQGTFDQCEEWLDHEENMACRAQSCERNQQRLQTLLNYFRVLRPTVARWFGTSAITSIGRRAATLARRSL